MIRVDCKQCHQYEAQAGQGGLCHECASTPIPTQLGARVPNLASTRVNGEAIPCGTLHRTSWSASDLLGATFDDPRFAVDGLIPEGLTFMCGAPKLGKSWLALGLALAVASGGKALGSVPVERGEALYLALEDSPRRLQTRLRMLLPDELAPAGLRLETEWPRLDEGGRTGSTIG
jgi:hypothetical protein